VLRTHYIAKLRYVGGDRFSLVGDVLFLQP